MSLCRYPFPRIDDDRPNAIGHSSGDRPKAPESLTRAKYFGCDRLLQSTMLRYHRSSKRPQYLDHGKGGIIPRIGRLIFKRNSPQN
jgi:hypothetical protein